MGSTHSLSERHGRRDERERKPATQRRQTGKTAGGPSANFHLADSSLDSRTARTPAIHRHRLGHLLTCPQWEPCSARDIHRPETRARPPENMRGDTPPNPPGPTTTTETVAQPFRKIHEFRSKITRGPKHRQSNVDCRPDQECSPVSPPPSLG
jgi:hypothetical protein